MRVVRVDLHARGRVFDGWGTSLAWWASAVGRLPRTQREAAVSRIFGLADGGLGLTVARFNAGGGENPAVIPTMSPRAVMEGYRPTPTADFDETADPGQRAVLRDAAHVVAGDGGEFLVEVFGNSPPWWATLSGSVTGASSAPGCPAPNLNPIFARDYLRYLGDVAQFVERDAGVKVASISPFNEPTSRWWVLGGRQEGCHFTPEGIDGLLTELARTPEAFRGHALAATEEWSLGQAITTWDALGPSARRLIRRLNVHTYEGAVRSAVRARAARAGADLWVSEFGEGDASGRELALGIVRDLRELEPSAWVLWQAISQDAWGVMRLGAGGSVAEAPKFEVLARFTRSIRPGMRLAGTDDVHSVAALGEGRLSVVLLGDPDAEKIVRLEIPGARVGQADVTIVVTGADSPVSTGRISALDGTMTFALPAGGVASVTAQVEVGADDGGFLGSGVWWLEHESGTRLGLAASGDDELGAGARVAGVAADDLAFAQRWRAEACGDGSVRWVCEASGHRLDVERASGRPGAHAIQWEAGLAEKTPAHGRFDILEGPDESVMLVARHSALALALDERRLGVQRRLGEPGTRWSLRRADPLGG